MADTTSASFSSELRFAIGAVREAGVLILKYFKREMDVRHKSRDNPVTAADLEADRCLREAFAESYPEDGWLSEETVDSHDRLARKRVWIVDPLDGTREFVKGLPEFAISLALVDSGSPSLAVVFNPAQNDLFAAERGNGAYRNGTRIQTSRRTALAGSRLLGSRSEATQEMLGQLASSTTLKIVGSIAYKLALVAANAADLTISVRPKSEWDVCAGSLLIEEAGGMVTDLLGHPLAFNQPKPLVHGIVAANPALHDCALQWVSRHPSILANLK